MRIKFLILGALIAYAGGAFAFDTAAKQAILIDNTTKTVLLDKKADIPMPTASMSKLMTAYMVFDALQAGRLNLDDEFIVSENAWRIGGAKSGGSTMFLNPKQSVKVRDLLRGIIVQSGNDACIVVAENMAGSEEAFAKQMNLKAKEIGLKNSNFENATGLPAPNHKMSPKDLALLANEIINRFPQYYSIYSETEFKFNGIKQGNRNPLLGVIDGADGLKTGHTEEAGFGLVGSAKDSTGRRLIMVIAGLPSMKARTAESQKLMRWGLNNFENVKLFSANAVLDKVPVWLGKEKTVDIIPEKEVLFTIPKGEGAFIKTTLSYQSPVSAPIQQGQQLGTLKIKTSTEEITVPVIAASAVEKTGIFGKIIAVIGSWMGK